MIGSATQIAGIIAWLLFLFIHAIFCYCSLADAIKKKTLNDWLLAILIWTVSVITMYALFFKMIKI
jgi:hypothetical protein